MSVDVVIRQNSQSADASIVEDLLRADVSLSETLTAEATIVSAELFADGSVGVLIPGGGIEQINVEWSAPPAVTFTFDADGLIESAVGLHLPVVETSTVDGKPLTMTGQSFGNPYTTTLTYQSDGLVDTIHESDTGVTRTFAYDPITFLPTSMTVS